MGKAQRKKRKRRERLVDLQKSLLERAGGAQEELDHYLNAPHHGETVVISGNHDINAPSLEGYLERGHIIPRELLQEPIILLVDPETAAHRNVSRISNLHVRNDLAHPLPSPVSVGRIFSMFVFGQNRESFVGDLEERYARIFQTEGRRSAVLWLWREIGHSLLSLGLASLKRLSGVAELIARYRRIGS
jgi:hypothetical protein